MKSKFIKAIYNLKPNKSAGIYETQAELWEFIGKDIKNILFKMIKKNCEIDIVPKNVIHSRTIIISENCRELSIF